jgi:hypothetical protein
MTRSTDPVIAQYRGLIRRFGFAYVAVGYGQCSEPGCTEPHSLLPWSYTIGLWRSRGHELVVTGLDPHLAGCALNQAVDGIDRGVAIRTVDVPDAWVACDPGRIGMWFPVTGRHVPPPFRQVLVADAAGRFPGDPGVELWHDLDQPLLSADPFELPYPPAA